MKSVTNINLRKLGKVLISMQFYEEAWMVHDIMKMADTRAAVKEIFLSHFPAEPRGLVVSVSQNYFDKFKNSENIKRDNLSAFLNNKELNEIIDILKGKAKEEKVTEETALERFRKSETIPEELIKLLGVEQEEELLELEQSDISKQHYPWVISILMNDEEDPMFEIISAIKIWDRNKEELAPLEEYRSLSELRGSIDGLGTTSKSAYLYSIKNHANDPANTDIIYDSDNFTVVLCGTTMSSQWWADGTVWCTSYLDGNMFEHYSGDGIYLYYLISKNDEAIKKYDKIYNNARSPSWAGRYTRWSYGGRNAQNLEKISIGYVKKDGESILLTNQNATVDKANHNISREDIENYLGDEAGPVFNAIEKDLDGRGETKFEQIKRNTTPEVLAQQIVLLEQQDMGYMADDIARYFLTDSNVREDTAEYAAKWFFDKSSDFWATDIDEIRTDRGDLVEDYPQNLMDIRKKYRKMEAERLINQGKYNYFLRSNLKNHHPEYSYVILKNMDYGIADQPDEQEKDDYDRSYRHGYWRDDPISIVEFLNFAGDLANKHVFDKKEEFSDIQRNIKRNFEKAISLGDPELLYLNNHYDKYRAMDHLDNLANLYEGGKKELYEVMKPAIESAVINNNPQAYFRMEWFKIYPDLEDKAINSVIARDPELILESGYIMEKYPNLIPVGLWGTRIKDIVFSGYYRDQKYAPMIKKLFKQINQGERIPNHPLLFTISNKDKLRTKDLDDLRYDPEILRRFTDIVRESTVYDGDEETEMDERAYGMKPYNMLPSAQDPRGISEELMAEIEDIDYNFEDDYYDRYYEDMVGPDVPIEPSEDDEDVEKEEESGDPNWGTWGENIPELQRLIEDNNNREVRASRLKSLYKFARLCAA